MQITKPPLNVGQTEAADGFFAFLLDQTKREMGIDGPGGVGKSFLLAHFIDEVIKRYYDMCELMGIKPEFDEVHITATTNKAADVLAVATGRPTQTIQSFMNLKVVEDYSSGRTSLQRTRNWKVHNNKIIFIDECSMIDRSLDQFIYDGTENCKIVYVGDDKQLTPVMGGLSPIYQRGIKFYSLTQPMRTQIPEILSLHEQLRETVATGQFKPIKIVPGIIDYLDDNQMQNELQNTFGQNNPDSRVLCYTNERVLSYNDYVRDYRKLPADFTVGEVLVNNHACQLPAGMLSTEQQVTVTRIGKRLHIPMEGGVQLEVQFIDIESSLGTIHNDVPIAVDRNHLSELIKWHARNKNWGTYFELKQGYPDLRMKDASTVYKAQGSTFDTVFVDLWDISKCRNPDQAARSLYVALSRMRKRAFLYGQLADRFGGLIR